MLSCKRLLERVLGEGEPSHICELDAQQAAGAGPHEPRQSKGKLANEATESINTNRAVGSDHCEAK